MRRFQHCTIRLYKHSAKGVYRQISCQEITRLNLLSSLDCKQTIEEPHPRKEIGLLRVTNT